MDITAADHSLCHFFNNNVRSKTITSYIKIPVHEEGWNDPRKIRLPLPWRRAGFALFFGKNSNSNPNSNKITCVGRTSSGVVNNFSIYKL